MEYKCIQKGNYKYYLPIVSINEIDNSWSILAEQDFQKDWPKIGYEVNHQGIYRIFPFYNAKLIYETFGMKLCQINLRTNSSLNRTYYIDANSINLNEDEAFIFYNNTIVIAKKEDINTYKLQQLEA